MHFPKPILILKEIDLFYSYAEYSNILALLCDQLLGQIWPSDR